MEKIFGGVDYVEAGESVGSEKREVQALANEDEEKRPTSHVEGTPIVAKL